MIFISNKNKKNKKNLINHEKYILSLQNILTTLITIKI